MSFAVPEGGACLRRFLKLGNFPRGRLAGSEAAYTSRRFLELRRAAPLRQYRVV